MSNLNNKFQLIGHIGEISVTTPKEKKVANFSLATNYKANNKETVTWFNLVAFDKTAEILEKYAVKGSKLAVEGFMSNNKYTDKEGIERHTMNFNVSEVLLLSSKKED